MSEEEASVFAFACRQGRISLTDIKAITGKTNQECMSLAQHLKTQFLLKKVDEHHFDLDEQIQARFEATMGTEQASQAANDLFPDEGGQITSLSDQHYLILALCEVPRSLKELRRLTGAVNKGDFQARIINPLLKSGLIEMVKSEPPHAKHHAYILTEHGFRFVSARKRNI